MQPYSQLGVSSGKGWHDRSQMAMADWRVAQALESPGQYEVCFVLSHRANISDSATVKQLSIATDPFCVLLLINNCNNDDAK